MSGANCSELEKCMCTMIQTFRKYSGDDADKKTLDKRELRKMLKAELPNFVPKDPQKLESFMTSLDCSGDEKVDFVEFACAVATLTSLCYELLDSCSKE
ncbi:protein S100-A2-like [Stegostoma tigrinum]|uniref:protein S100-A2-like n=1 Tax=Stegostoma tigrinum TaxID=3053191 RepID=UPI00286FDCA6|nr:protein S100-A2-like [Stegostoma tigrinum]XP_059494448.1 protein S100-A2-like [Stegostoma tigrinum]